MAVLGIGTLAEYVAYLEGTPAELEVLFRTLLIGVTQFFRDPEAFKALEEQVLPRLLEAGSARTGLRIWSPGCSTGEEAYSLAILLRERLEATGLKPGIQIFATDLDRQALVIARAGRYPASIAHDLSSGRLARFFTAEADGTTYQVHKDIRDLLVLSEQDLIKNPPLAHLDLIVCRNLLIYLGKDLHRRVLPLFHRALNPGGFLFLGTTENLGACGDLFTVLDGKAKLFQRKESKGPEPTLCPDRRSVAKGGRAAGGPNYLGTGARTSLRELTEQALLRQLAPAGALVDARGEILYLHGSTGTYLELPPGEPDHPNILKMARSGLRRGLAAALRKAVASGETVRSPGFRLPALHGHLEVDLTVGPVVAAPGTAGPLYLVVLEEAPCPVPDGAEPAPGARTGTEATQVELRGEAQSEQDELQEAAEVLASSNEELQAVNDDLQSTNAVLQTGKDELQSANEELATGNGELQATVADLVQANQDLNNLLAGTGLAAVFVDPAMKVLRFTPTATRIINLIPADCGRPMGHIASNLVGYDRLVQDVQEVLDTLSPKVQEVRTLDGKVYTMSIQPYRSLDDAPEGAVLTFVHPSGTKRSEAKANVP
jgi:two-component system CheB/CheR fusion protein